MPLPNDLREKLKNKEPGQTNAATTPEPPRLLHRQLPAGEEFPAPVETIKENKQEEN